LNILFDNCSNKAQEISFVTRISLVKGKRYIRDVSWRDPAVFDNFGNSSSTRI